MEFASDRARRERDSRPSRNPYWKRRQEWRREREPDETLKEATDAQRRRYYRSRRPDEVAGIVKTVADWAHAHISSSVIDATRFGEHKGRTVYLVDTSDWEEIGSTVTGVDNKQLVHAAREEHELLAEQWGFEPCHSSVVIAYPL